jgi:capsular polysaccharide biosynthesis protein
MASRRTRTNRTRTAGANRLAPPGRPGLRAGRRVVSLGGSPGLRRTAFVLALAVVAAATAWFTVAGAAPVYERTVSLVVVPDPQKGPSDVSSEIVTTISGGIGSRRFLTQAANKALGPRAPLKKYTLEAFVRPGSDIIDTRLHGPSPRTLKAVADAYTQESRGWTAQHYVAYRLAFLEAKDTPGKVSPHPKRTAALAFILGALVGVLALFVDAQVRADRRFPWGLTTLGSSAHEPSVEQPAPFGDQTTDARLAERRRTAGREPR